MHSKKTQKRVNEKKVNICEQILYFLSDIHKNEKTKKNEMK